MSFLLAPQSHHATLAAKKSDCRISLGTDSRGPTQLRFIELGLASAMLAGVPQERILNFMSREEVLKWSSNVRVSAKSK